MYNSSRLSYPNTSVKIIKNEVGCRDDTVPKTVETRKALRGGLRACNNLPQRVLMIFTLVPLIFFSHKYGQDAVDSLASLVYIHE